MKKAFLVLEDGSVFEGQQMGADAESIGELVFTTGMVGYLETLTDPSYAGQIVVQTFPMIGNYGVIPSDFEGKSAIKGYVVRELCGQPSNFRSESELDAFLKAQGICCICGVDTRQITRRIREHGVMNAGIFREIPKDLSAVVSYRVTGVVSAVGCKQPSVIPADVETKFRVALLDYGAKKNIVRSLTARGCEVTVFPQDTKAETILAMQPDGVMLSNGPGDPAENTACIAELRKLIGKLPVFGICLGHQLAALAMGGQTVKLPYGHRGANQPVREVNGQRTYITSQNHGYAVVSDSLRGVAEESFVNANDGSCEGLTYRGLGCFTVQFHPEAAAGPHDTSFLFDRFLAMMEAQHEG